MEIRTCDFCCHKYEKGHGPVHYAIVGHGRFRHSVHFHEDCLKKAWNTKVEEAEKNESQRS